MVKSAKTISNIIYLVGVICVLVLTITAIFGSDELSNPNAMVSLNFSAFICLIVGMFPMFFACMAVYIFNDIKNSKHKKRNFILIFSPGFICFSCFLFLMLGGTIINLFT